MRKIIALLLVLMMLVPLAIAEDDPENAPPADSPRPIISNADTFSYVSSTGSVHTGKYESLVRTAYIDYSKDPSKQYSIDRIGADGNQKGSVSLTKEVFDKVVGQAGTATGGVSDTAQTPKGKSSFNAGTISDFLHQEYPGLANLGGLLMGDMLDDWKKTVDDAFCSTVILGGKSCWVAAACGTSPENAGGDGVLWGEDYNHNQTRPMFIAHVEGQRSAPAEHYENGTLIREWAYKITYSIRNPDEDEGNGYQLRYFYPGGSYDWFPTWQPLVKDLYVSRTGASAIVAYSNRYYTRVCLVFMKPVTVQGTKIQQVCNSVVEYSGGPTSVPGVASTVEGGAAVGTPKVAGEGF